jgi:ribosome-associated protein
VAKHTKPTTSKTLATFCAKLALEKLASDVLVLDISEYEFAQADYFVLCSSDVAVQSNAILDFVLREAKTAGLDKPKVEGELSGDWILIDFFDVVMHIMLKPIREFYDIEGIWSDATKYELNAETNRLNKI